MVPRSRMCYHFRVDVVTLLDIVGSCAESCQIERETYQSTKADSPPVSLESHISSTQTLSP